MNGRWSVEILGDYINQFLERTDMAVLKDAKGIIVSIDNSPGGSELYRRIKKLAKDRLFTKDGTLRIPSARALANQFGFKVERYVPVGELDEVFGIWTRLGIIVVDDF